MRYYCSAPPPHVLDDDWRWEGVRLNGRDPSSHHRAQVRRTLAAMRARERRHDEALRLLAAADLT